MPSEADQRRWIEANEAARRRDRAADAERSMADLLEETARLSAVVSELRENIVHVLAHLRLMKETAGRPQDLVDLESLPAG